MPSHAPTVAALAYATTVGMDEMATSLIVELALPVLDGQPVRGLEATASLQLFDWT
jgi:hypothetical protein